ncbi:hypothetical protein NV379_02090 [Paenibacillus sp. N1-5-1-14]|uniref:DUF7446 family protein n=1 Tax=Paenibacillus radicibacter TaxID=2972488 RepID=UPI0021596E59|nr:hypothetical protein [Paenibacillus radicibacter]MCR8641436.1 hypothetical protein [Paenibacillus radicibacter]
MSLNNLKIRVSPITNTIYAGYTTGNTVRNKIDITKQVYNALMQHMDQDREIEILSLAGTITFAPKGSKDGR